MTFVEYVFLYITIYLSVLTAICCKPLIFREKQKKEEAPQKIYFDRRLFLRIVSSIEKYKFNITENDKNEIIADAYGAFESVYGTIGIKEFNHYLDDFIRREVENVVSKSEYIFENLND